jgi:hypothetical protein
MSRPGDQPPAGDQPACRHRPGKHEWHAGLERHLTSDEIDALAGFILSSGGSSLFTTNCAKCHQAAELVASDLSN